MLTLPLDSDQRITDDSNKFSLEFKEICSRLIIWPFLVGYYTYSSWNLAGYLAPVIIYLFFIVGTAINSLVAGFLVGVIFEQERLEGNFRFLHMSLRISAEPVAFLDGIDNERSRLDQSLILVIANQRIVVNRTAAVKCWLLLANKTNKNNSNNNALLSL